MSHNSWLHRMVRNSVVKPLAKTPVTPNQLTIVRLLTGIAAAACMAIGPGWQALGGGVFVVSVFLDRADGDLARLTGQTSASGHRYDMIADTVCNALILIGLGVGLRDGGYGLWAAPMGVLAGSSVAAILWMVMRMEDLGGHRAAELPSFGGFDADDAVLLIPVFVWLGMAEGLLTAAAIIAPLVALMFFGMFRRRLASSEPQ
ncbi:MAG: CDP-alcohol phosphatidyltransferase family protein [Rhodospirillales bacterium]|nr:CDP-alcohol phosphatidyltransferase family protein [Alphaproteobacteria bacterium]MBL6948500.1 CDP-alcohol phosphatidyltransferase family protein [Rhodospirillales bacterium]